MLSFSKKSLRPEPNFKEILTTMAFSVHLQPGSTLLPRVTWIGQDQNSHFEVKELSTEKEENFKETLMILEWCREFETCEKEMISGRWTPIMRDSWLFQVKEFALFRIIDLTLLLSRRSTEVRRRRGGTGFLSMKGLYHCLPSPIGFLVLRNSTKRVDLDCSSKRERICLEKEEPQLEMYKAAALFEKFLY